MLGTRIAFTVVYYAALLAMPVLRLKEDFLKQQDVKTMGYLSVDE